MNPKIKNLLVIPNMTLRETMKAIDGGGTGIALVVDSEGHLKGTVTDGDIRRAILKGIGLDVPVSAIMQVNPITVTPETDTQAIRKIFMESMLKHIPIVDHLGRLQDVILVNDLLSVPLSNPDITEKEVEAVLEVLRTPDLSLGPKLNEFEQKIAAYVGRKFAIAVNSGTAGLHLLVKGMGLGSGDEVITTPFSFIASSNCLLYENVRPVFVDIELDTYNIDVEKIERAITPRTRAILVVDVFGQPVRYDEIESIARKHNLYIISDCCESIGAEYMGRMAGSWGVGGVFAFYPNKQITTGEGGAIVTDDPEIARLCRSMRNQGRSEKGGWLMHERLGYNYRLPEINCALGIAQLDRIEDILKQRQRVANIYNAALKDLKNIHIPYIHPLVSRMSWFVYVIRLADHLDRTVRDAILQKMRAQGIGVNCYFQPIHLQPFYSELFGYKEGDYSITEFVAHRTIALPFHNQLSEDDANAVVNCLITSMKDAS